jgi:hypothetical protein
MLYHELQYKVQMVRNTTAVPTAGFIELVPGRALVVTYLVKGKGKFVSVA